MSSISEQFASFGHTFLVTGIEHKPGEVKRIAVRILVHELFHKVLQFGVGDVIFHIAVVG